MRETLRRKPSPAMVVAVIALVMASAGTATAARVLITNSAQIRQGSVNSGDVRNGALRGGDLRPGAIGEREVKNGALTLEKLDASARASVSNATVRAIEVVRRTGPVDQSKGKLVRVATVQALEPGVWAIFAKTTLTANRPSGGLLNSGESDSGHCVLDAAGDKDDARALLGGPGANSPATLNLQITRTYSETAPVTLECETSQTTWRASDTSIIALKVSSAPKVAVDG